MESKKRNYTAEKRKYSEPRFTVDDSRKKQNKLVKKIKLKRKKNKQKTKEKEKESYQKIKRGEKEFNKCEKKKKKRKLESNKSQRLSRTFPGSNKPGKWKVKEAAPNLDSRTHTLAG